MKKAGEILREARLKAALTIEEVSQETKIRAEFLRAIEKSDYRHLPSPIYIRGFISSFAKAVNLAEDKVMPFYRREVELAQQTDVKKLPQPLNFTSFKITPAKLITGLVALVLTGFLIILYFQYRSYAGIPLLIIDYPPDNHITNQLIVEVRGRADPEADLTINGEEVQLNIEGIFVVPFNLNEGLNRIKIVAKNKLGKENAIEKVVERKNE